MDLKALVEIINGAFEGTIVMGVNIGAGNWHERVGLDACAFESQAARSLVVKLTDIEHTAIRQRVPVSNRQHTATRAGADNLRASFRLQCRREDLRGARRIRTRQQ